jgi:hypothetical protein
MLLFENLSAILEVQNYLGVVYFLIFVYRSQLMDGQVCLWIQLVELNDPLAKAESCLLPKGRLRCNPIDLCYGELPS